MAKVDTAPVHVDAVADEQAPTVSTSTTSSNAFAYHASLDGLRAFAVLAVIAFHYDYGWSRGGWLGVDLFFVLSGFLISTLLILEWQRAQTIKFARFWARRARRLLPALMVLLVFVTIMTVRVIDPWDRATVRGDAIASLFYVANWRFIVEKQGYFELFAVASPLRHMWTLAIEEQFYLVWPLVVFATMRLSRGSFRVLAGVCVLGIVASVAAMSVLYGPGDPLRAYYGTDARAHSVLMGALLAIVLLKWRLSAVARRRLVIVGVAAFAGMLYTWHVVSGTSTGYYGGSLLFAALACVVIAAALQRGVVQSGLSFRPLAWTGRISYGLYLFHWPLIVLLVPTRLHMHGLQLNALRLALTFAAATISFYLVELPIRERRRPALPWKRPEPFDRTDGRAPRRNVVGWLALPAVALTLAIVLVSTTGASPAPSYLIGTRPTGKDIPWGFGDPLFCGTPRASETQEAVNEARRLGPPELPRSAARLRVLVVGDSIACSFFPGLKAVGEVVGATVDQASVFGCGVASGQITTTRHEQITPHSERCPAMVDAAVNLAITEMQPDVVVWMSLWEKSDVVVGNRMLVSGTPAGDDEMLRRMDAALAELTRKGAKVVLVTVAAPAPNDAQGTNNTSNAIDNASYGRLDSIDRRFAARHPGRVTLVDLARRLCPDGPPCPEDVDGLRMRPDGRHFTPNAASIEARWLMPKIVATARG